LNYFQFFRIFLNSAILFFRFSINFFIVLGFKKKDILIILIFRFVIFKIFLNFLI